MNLLLCYCSGCTYMYHYNTGQKIPQMSELTGRNHRCRAQCKCAQTVLGQRSAGNGPNGLSNDYYYYYYYILLLLLLLLYTTTIYYYYYYYY